MTTPAATAALARALDDLWIEKWDSPKGQSTSPITAEEAASIVLRADFTPAERAALAAALLAPEVLAEALMDVWPAGSAGSPYIGRLGMPDIAAAILAALAARGAA